MDIRFCLKSDIAGIMTFLGEHWSPNHALSRSRKLMDWQHSGTSGRDYDFVGAFDRDEVFGCLGFINTSRFDPALAGCDTVWLTTWKARKDAPPGLGLQLHAFVDKNVPHHAIGTVGNNLQVAVIYRALRYQTGAMTQHYVLNPAMKSFCLAGVPVGAPRAGNCERDNCVLRLCSGSDLEAMRDVFHNVECVPRKSACYFKTRFIEHPFYSYEVYAIEREGRPLGVLACRLAGAEGAKALRIVDVYAPDSALAGLAEPLQKLLVAKNAEYADFYQSGHGQDAMCAAGLLTLDSAGEVIIPNYFEPFVRRNVAINWACKIKGDGQWCPVKADCDQDRPSILE